MHNSLRLRDSSRQTPQGLRILLGAFRGGNPLERTVGVPSLWPRPGGVLQQHGLGVTRPSDNLTANITDGRYSSNWNRTQLTSRRRSLTSSLVKGFVSLFGLCGGVLLLQTWCDPARNRSFELQDEPLLSKGPAAVHVGEADGVGVLLVHLLPVLSSINRVVGSGWSNRQHGGTRCVRHHSDTPAVSRGTMAALFPSLAAVVTVGGIWLHQLRMIIVSADDYQPLGIHDSDREDALVQAGDERRLGGGPRLARIGGVEDA